MSKIDENQIHRRLKAVSQIKPSSEATGRAIKRVRDTLINEEKSRQSTNIGIWRTVFKSPVTKLAAAAVLMLAAGYAVGRLSAPTVDTEELRAGLKQELLKEMDERWQSAFTANCAQLKEELHQQVRRDLTEFATQTLVAASTLTNQRLMELAQLIEAARRRERQQVAAALEQIEQDTTQLEKGLLAIAVRTSELRRTEQN